MRIALFQPDIPHNTGAILRLSACLGLGVDIIEPCGFLWEDKRLRRAGMDYRDLAAVTRHDSWARFLERLQEPGPKSSQRESPQQASPGQTAPRLVLLSTKAAVAHTDFAFREDDILLLGRESAGVPADVFARADARVTIPMAPGARSLNVAMAAAVVVGEALRQTAGYPRPDACPDAHPDGGPYPASEPAAP